MKWIARTILLLMFFVSSPLSAESPQPSYWFCRVVGIEKGKSPNQVMYLSEIFSDEEQNHYEKREKAFTEHVVKKVSKSRFEPKFDAKCRDYLIKKTAEKHRKEEIKTAKAHQFKVKNIEWKWVVPVEGESE